MAYSTKLSIAIHILLAIVRFGEEERQTSTALAGSIQVNPVIVRNLLQQLKKAGLVQVDKGIGGAYLAKQPHDITLYEVFAAVENSDKPLFKQHDNPNPDCPLGREINSLVKPEFDDLKNQVYRSLQGKNLQDLVDKMNRQH